MRVLPSTAGQTTWAVIDEGCVASPRTAPNCPQERAWIFTYNASTTWESKGNHVLGLKANFGRDSISAAYGLDTVALGFNNGIGGPVLDRQVIASLTKNSYYIGTFGLGQQPTNFSTLDDSIPSFLTNLVLGNIIPSRS